MDQAKTLVRTVVRAFYDVEHIIAIDAVVNHTALTIEDFKQIFAAGGRQPKEIAKYLGKLREGGLLSCYGRQETKPGAQKATTVEYWWIDYQFAVDAIKYHLHVVEEQLNRLGRVTTEKKEFFCPVCKSEWTQFEVIDNPDPQGRGSGFLCKRCNSLLSWRAPDEDEGPSEGSNKVSQFNTQLGHILNLVQAIDQLHVPLCTPENAIESLKPVPKQKEVGVADIDLPDYPTMLPTSVKGVKAQAENVEIVLDTESQRTAEEQKAEAERKAKIFAQNQLPEWHTKSTISGDATGRGGNADPYKEEISIPTIVETTAKKASGLDASVMANIFDSLEAEKAQVISTQASEDESDEDEDEFEDVTSPVLKKPRLEEVLQVEEPVKVEQPETVVVVPEPKAESTNKPMVAVVAYEDDSEEEEFEEVQP
jgi:transcription initiation factor TFIIE subunit alpha